MDSSRCLIPAITGGQAIKVFAKDGFELVRVSKSSHHVLKKPGHVYHLSVPVHGKKTLKAGTLRSLIRAAGITVDRFIELMNE